jgi:hypothetical protein
MDLTIPISIAIFVCGTTNTINNTKPLSKLWPHLHRLGIKTRDHDKSKSLLSKLTLSSIIAFKR